MKSIQVILILILLPASLAFAQVSEIKSASSDNASKSSNRESGGGSSDGASSESGGGWFVGMLLNGIADLQSYKLKDDRERYPSMVSLDVMVQSAIKPSSYYIIWPRIRANWGLFSTDFRMNYLIEDGIDGFEHIRTNDWQVIQINLVTSRYFTFRLGTGFMQEAFNTKRSFSESAFMVNIHAPDQSKLIGLEYRFAKDFETDATPRKEFSIQYQQEIFETGKLHGYATIGAVYQNYYSSIDVWGIQLGMVIRLF
jgi:hypothetical protein